MRMLLIFVNILLASVIVFGAFAAFSSGSEEPVTAVRKKIVPRTGSPQSAKNAEKVKKEFSPSASGDRAAAIVRNNIFNPERCPDARIPGRTNSSVQLTMTLVGTVTAGKVQAAIILQKNRNLNAMQNTQWMRNNPGTDGRTFNPRSRPGGESAPGSNASANSQETEITYKQYVRVGETLANGYTLESVTRTGAVLVKGGDRLELTIQEASKGRASAPASPSSPSPGAARPGPNAPPDREQIRRMIEERRRSMEPQRTPDDDERPDRSGSTRGSRPSRSSRGPQ